MSISASLVFLKIILNLFPTNHTICFTAFICYYSFLAYSPFLPRNRQVGQPSMLYHKKESHQVQQVQQNQAPRSAPSRLTQRLYQTLSSNCYHHVSRSRVDCMCTRINVRQGAVLQQLLSIVCQSWTGNYMSNTYMPAYNFRPKRITVLMGKFMWMAIANSLDLIRYAPTFFSLRTLYKVLSGCVKYKIK